MALLCRFCGAVHKFTYLVTYLLVKLSSGSLLDLATDSAAIATQRILKILLSRNVSLDANVYNSIINVIATAAGRLTYTESM